MSAVSEHENCESHDYIEQEGEVSAFRIMRFSREHGQDFLNECLICKRTPCGNCRNHGSDSTEDEVK